MSHLCIGIPQWTSHRAAALARALERLGRERVAGTDLYWPAAETPVSRRKLGYYALPLLWREDVVGWGNLSVARGRLVSSFGYVRGSTPPGPAFRRGLAAELERLCDFLGVSPAKS